MTFFSDDSVSRSAGNTPVDHEAGPSAAERRSRFGWVLVGIALVITLALAFAPSSYVIETPGPVYDTLGTAGEDEIPLITISDAPVYETSGSLDLLTVSVIGAPDGGATLFEVATSWFDPSRAVVPLEAVYAPGQTTEQQREDSELQMENSQLEAVAAALTQLDYDFPRTVSVVGLLEDSASEGVLEEGDVIVSVNGAAINGLTDLREKVDASGAGEPAEIGVERDGEARTVEVTPQDQDGAVVLGVGVQVEYEFPIDVDIELENVGGPSAGMMFALGIFDKLTPGELTGGAVVAGTGTIDGEGEVGAIGGIRQKLYGAERSGATLFLAPQSNCTEVVGHVPAGLDVVSVSTLEDAVSALQAVAAGADPASLPGCEAD